MGTLVDVNSTDSATPAESGFRFDVLGVIAIEAALVMALHLTASPAYAVPLQSLPDWFSVTDPTTALVALARIVALAIGYWLLTTTVLYAAAHYLGWESMTDTLRWVTLPVVRRFVQGVTAMSLTSASLVGPAAVSVMPAMAQTEAVVVQADGEGETTELQSEIDSPTSPEPGSYRPDAAGWPQPDLGGSNFWVPAPATNGAQAEAGTHLVQRGEHLWGIAERHLRSVTGRDVTEDEVCQYWVKLMDANRGGLRSGDPDLIYPDERITLPAVFS